MKKSFVLLAAALLALTATAQTRTAAPAVKASDYQFTTVKEIPVTSMKNQANSGTCWCFSAISFLESEIISSPRSSRPRTSSRKPIRTCPRCSSSVTPITTGPSSMSA